MGKGKMFFSEYTDGSVHTGYTDYGVEGMGDYEANYSLDAENAEKLKQILSEMHHGSFEEMMISEFGECMDKCSFSDWCDRHGIKYKQFIWID